MSTTGYLIVNFGGPRSKEEITPFLSELLTDPDVISTPFPLLLQNLFFRRVAKKRATQIRHDYTLIGGKSPIYDDTESVAQQLNQTLKKPVFTFHRYLKDTHAHSLSQLEAFTGNEIIVFPLFPQFSYSTTGSIARLLTKKLTPKTLQKLKWIKSYPDQSSFTHLFQNNIRRFLHKKNLCEQQIMLLFSAHGLPQNFVDQGDPYEHECRMSYEAVKKAFPHTQSLLCYQSKFGRGEWLKPYTQTVCETIDTYSEGRKHILIIPLSFTSDHIETLFEIEHQYLPILSSKGYGAYRLPAFNRSKKWIEAIDSILRKVQVSETKNLIRYS